MKWLNIVALIIFGLSFSLPVLSNEVEIMFPRLSCAQFDSGKDCKKAYSEHYRYQAEIVEHINQAMKIRTPGSCLIILSNLKKKKVSIKTQCEKTRHLQNEIKQKIAKLLPFPKPKKTKYLPEKIKIKYHRLNNYRQHRTRIKA